MSTTNGCNNESENKSNMIFILDTDSTTSKYKCPLTTCKHLSSSVSAILNHMWKFKKKNAVNKSCTGQTSPSITLYPKLFYDSKFEESTNPIFQQEYPQYKWEIIQQYINPSDDSPPNIISLIKEFNFFITTDYIQNYPQIEIPSSLQDFILDTDFDCHELQSMLTNIKQPPHKKRKISSTESIEINNSRPTLSLPSLNMSPKSYKNTNITEALSFDLNSPRINKNKNRNNKKKKRLIGPVCDGCNTAINPCHTMIKCTECIDDIIICICCFKQGKEFMTHKRFHKYNVLRPLINFRLKNDVIECDENNNMKGRKSNKLSHNKWNANDEWNLLYGIKRYGLGNWSGITKIINKNNINTENIKHFDYKHVESHFHLKYKHKIYKAEEELTEEYNNNNMNRRAASIPLKKHNKKGRKYASNFQSSKESKFTDKHKLKCGYRELRDEFEAEWNNDAEAMIGEMYFSEYDTEKERALKMEGLRLYNKVLEERKNRKQFIKNYGVIYGKRARNKKNLSEEELKLEEEISNNLSKFARYTQDKHYNFSEFKSLIHGLMEEKQLREKIYKLRHYLLNGITNISQMNRIEKYIEVQNQLGNEIDNIDEITDVNDINDYKNANEYLNKFHGCGLDQISTYLMLIDKKNNSNNMEEQNSDNDTCDEYNKNWNLKTMAGYNQLSEGEIRLCNVLKIAPKDYKLIQKEISKRVYVHGLLKKDKVPQQLCIDIDDVKNVKDSMTMRIGLVDPRVLTDQMSKINE